MHRSLRRFLSQRTISLGPQVGRCFGLGRPWAPLWGGPSLAKNGGPRQPKRRMRPGIEPADARPKGDTQRSLPAPLPSPGHPLVPYQRKGDMRQWARRCAQPACARRPLSASAPAVGRARVRGRWLCAGASAGLLDARGQRARRPAASPWARQSRSAANRSRAASGQCASSIHLPRSRSPSRPDPAPKDAGAARLAPDRPHCPRVHYTTPREKRHAAWGGKGGARGWPWARGRIAGPTRGADRPEQAGRRNAETPHLARPRDAALGRGLTHGGPF